MATAGNTAKVGAAVILALALFGGMWAFFLQASLLRHTYTVDVLFDDATGIDKGAPVQQSGVQVGTVDKVRLVGQRADLQLSLNDKVDGKPYRIPIGSQFVISTPLLGSTGILTIVPPRDAGKHPGNNIQAGAANLQGTRTGDLASSITRANGLIDQLTVTAKNANTLLADKRLQSNLLETVNNIDAASRGGAQLTDKLSRTLDTDNAQVLQLIQQTRTDSKLALSNINTTTGTFRDLATGNRAQLNEIVGNLRDTTASVAGLTQSANDLLKNGDINKNLSGTVANLKATTDKLALVAANIQTLTGDATIQANLKGTVQNIHDASAQTEALLERLNKIAGTKKKTTPTVIVGPGGAVVVPAGGRAHSNKIFVPLIAPRVDFLQNTRDKHFRIDVDAVAPLPGSTPGLFGRVGIYGIGDTDSAGKLILQGGKMLSPDGLADVRAGLYASKLSVGADYGLGRANTFSAELYDANKPHLDARGVFKVTPAVGLVLGGEDLTRRAAPLIGVQYRSSK